MHAEAKTFSADDCLLVFFPVYGGRVPGPCLARMRALRGTDTPAVLVAVFGNRAVDCLQKGDPSCVIGIRDNKIIEVDFEEVFNVKKQFDEDLYETARILGL